MTYQNEGMNVDMYRDVGMHVYIYMYNRWCTDRVKCQGTVSGSLFVTGVIFTRGHLTRDDLSTIAYLLRPTPQCFHKHRAFMNENQICSHKHVHTLFTQALHSILLVANIYTEIHITTYFTFILDKFIKYYSIPAC